MCWKREKRRDGCGAAVHQVDSRAAAVNTNNGEYRSVNCVLGSAEGGCASTFYRACPSVPLPPPFCPFILPLSLVLANFFSAVRPTIAVRRDVSRGDCYAHVFARRPADAICTLPNTCLLET